MASQLEGDRLLDPVRDRVDVVLRDSFEVFKEADAVDNTGCECGEEHYPRGSLLGDWAMIITWVQPDGDTGYTRLTSSGISPHARMGLARELVNRCP